MFSDKSYSPVSIPSVWDSSKSAVETGTQTADVVGVDKDEQTSYTRSTEVQTDNPELLASAVVDEKALAKFLNSICPKVLEELNKASKSKAFLSYQLPDEDASQEIRSIHHLVKPKNKVEDNLKVNSLTWSCTGSVIVLGLGSRSHDDWCSHTGFVHFYNINRNTCMSMTPSKVLEATSCVTSVATHPYEPSILACGLYRGNIILWNLQLDGAECIASVSSNNEPISQISWISASTGRPQLISSGLDGQMNLWNVSHAYDSISLKESYVLNETTETAVEAGVTCFSFSNSRPDVFVAALEGGKILHCCLNISKSSTRVGCSTPLKNPVIGNLEGHKGLVSCLAFSPYHEDLFLSVGTDQEIHVNSIFEVAPMRIIWCETEVLGIAWSPSQANIFMSWGQSSDIMVYDCKTGCKLSSVKTDIPSLCALAFNWKSPKLIAIGDTNGRGYVWQVPQYFKTGL